MQDQALGYSLDEWTRWMREQGESPYRASQVFDWIHQKHQTDFQKMQNLPKALREKLTASFNQEFLKPRLIQKQASSQKELGRTVKFLFAMADGSMIESVLLEYEYGFSLCVSSQVGCRMGCAFCASTLAGLERSLTAAEMLGQVYAVEKEEEVHISHVVIMGSGEPFDNFDAVLSFLQLLHDPNGHNMSYRNMTVSTCGLAEKIRQLADLDLPITLAISLHAPNDSIRTRLMKVAKAYPLPVLMSACEYYVQKTNRRLTFEYSLMDGINCEYSHAKELAILLKSHFPGALCHVNLIPVNPVKECGFQKPSSSKVHQFMSVLEEAGIAVTLRREMASDVDGACGQLRAKQMGVIK